MSYQKAYTTQFHGLDDTLWNIDIYIDGYDARPVEIKLEGDEPCVIDWQETGKTDVVQGATCTLRVSNESDRQMLRLMSHTNAYIIVSRDGKQYWKGYQDDAIYEEPYSFAKAYVTELTFSDFGALNRVSFGFEGVRSVDDIVRDCLGSIGYGNGTIINLYTSLLDPKTRQPITLDMLYINDRRFASGGGSWGERKSKREVLEETLRPLGLRIMQKNGQIYIYDIEWLRDHDYCHNYPVWKGTDAYLRGSETFGLYEVAFEPDARETIADGTIGNMDSMEVPDRYWVKYCDEDSGDEGVGYYIRLYDTHGLGNPDGRVFKTRPELSSDDCHGYAWIAAAYDKNRPTLIPPRILANQYVRWPISSPGRPGASALFETVSDFLPLTPDRDRFQLRVNLDLLLSPKMNPSEDAERWNLNTDNSQLTPAYYKNNWTKRFLKAYVPVKLELIGIDGNVAAHYTNTTRITGAGGSYVLYPLSPGRGRWESGAADFGDMLLSYYNDGCEASALEGWATNRQTMAHPSKHLPSLYKKREQGEYVPMPPSAGSVRLTVSNCVYSPDYAIPADLVRRLLWHMLRNAAVTLVKAAAVDDDIETDPLYEREQPNPDGDMLSETVIAGTWRKGIAPSATGLFFSTAGTVWEKFIKNGATRTLEQHRLRCLEDQNVRVQPVISGTAELSAVFCAYKERSTPGVFLVTALRQDLHQATEEMTMARIAGVGGFVHEFTWSCPVCAEEEEPGTFAWSKPVCIKDPGPYKFSWSKAVCVKQYTYTLEWEEMQSYD